MDNEMQERRLTKDKDGNVIGGWSFGGDGKNAFCGSPTTPLLGAVAPVFFPQTTNQLQQMPLVKPLTAEQRLNELHKRISEYKGMLFLLNDGSAKSLMEVFLNNISRDLAEIQTEFVEVQARLTKTQTELIETQTKLGKANGNVPPMRNPAYPSPPYPPFISPNTQGVQPFQPLPTPITSY